MDVQDKIRVAVRVRPAGADAPDGKREKKEEKKDDAVVVNGNKLSLLLPQKEPRVFEFSSCHDRQDNNAKVFGDNVAGLVDKVVAGFNAFVVTYGAKSSGKTHTMYGDKSDPNGVIALAIDMLFQKIAGLKANTDFFVTLAAFHLREKGSLVVDLLNPKPSEVLQLNNHRALGTYVEPLAEIEVQSAEEARMLLTQAIRVQHALILRTPTMNYGHTFIDICVDAKDRDRPFVIRQGVLRFVMLQGSGGSAVRLLAGLSGLNEVVNDLAADKPQAQINYNVCALTRLLENGLGGNASTLFLLLLASQGENSLADCEHTLSFGDKVKNIRTFSKVNVNTIETAIKQLREEIKSAMKRLQLTHPRQYYHDISPAQLNNVKMLIQELDRVKKLSWDERKKLSTQAKLDRVDNLRKEGLSGVRYETEIDPKKTEEGRELLDKIADSMQVLQDLQIKLEEKEALLQNFHRSRANKGAGPEGGDGKEQKAPPGMLKNLQALQAQITAETSKMNTFEEEYKKKLAEIMDFEARKRMFEISPEAAKILQIRQWADYQTLRKTMVDQTCASGIFLPLQNSNPKLTQISESLKARFETEQKKITQSFDSFNVPPELAAARDELKNDGLRRHSEAHQNDIRAAELSFERNFLWTQLLEHQYRAASQMERYQQHMFFVFRDYRSHFEQQKSRIENRYRELLENSVKDALKLAEENARLKAELAKQDPSMAAGKRGN